MAKVGFLACLEICFETYNKTLFFVFFVDFIGQYIVELRVRGSWVTRKSLLLLSKMWNCVLCRDATERDSEHF